MVIKRVGGYFLRIFFLDGVLAMRIRITCFVVACTVTVHALILLHVHPLLIQTLIC